MLLDLCVVSANPVSLLLKRIWVGWGPQDPVVARVGNGLFCFVFNFLGLATHTYPTRTHKSPRARPNNTDTHLAHCQCMFARQLSSFFSTNIQKVLER